MKKQVKGFISGVLTTVLVLNLGITAMAGYTRQLSANFNGIKITLDGVQVTPQDALGNVVEPFIVDGTTYLPVRAVANMLSIGVDWDETTQTVKLSTEQSPSFSIPTPVSDKNAYGIGETWVVDGQWAFTITGVRETSERNQSWDQYKGKTPGAVYILDYTYTNLGYQHEVFDGLFMSMSSGSVVDCTGKMGDDYPMTLNKNPQWTPIGATCEAQDCIAVENPGNLKLTISQYDGTRTKQSAVFELEVG